MGQVFGNAAAPRDGRDLPASMARSTARRGQFAPPPPEIFCLRFSSNTVEGRLSQVQPAGFSGVWSREVGFPNFFLEDSYSAICKGLDRSDVQHQIL